MTEGADPRWPGERVVVDTRPSGWFVLLGKPAWLPLALGWIGCRRAELAGLAPDLTGPASGWLALGTGLALVWAILDWACRRYTLTDRRIVRSSGVLRRVTVEAPLRNVQSVTLLRSIRERVVGIGTIGVSTAGSAGFEMTWFMVGRSHEHLSAVRGAVADAQR